MIADKTQQRTPNAETKDAVNEYQKLNSSGEGTKQMKAWRQ